LLYQEGGRGINRDRDVELPRAHLLG
jgi:hypothetical protein